MDPLKNPIKELSRREWLLWLGSLAVVAFSNFASPDFDGLTMAAALIGATSLMFAAKGNVWSQVLTIVFSILYGIISYRFRYWGEMITYLGMTLPMAVWATVTWLKNPAGDHSGQVAIQTLNRRHAVGLLVFGTVITAFFYAILAALRTPNLFFSTVSIVTSFLAAALTMLRSSYYALGYAANDVVLIILWTLAALEDPAYLPVVVNFGIFLLNDLYGFLSWRKRELRQAEIG